MKMYYGRLVSSNVIYVPITSVLQRFSLTFTEDIRIRLLRMSFQRDLKDKSVFSSLILNRNIF